MRVPSRDARYGAFGILTGVAAVAAGRCGGGACLSCLACAVPGAAVVLAAAVGAWRRAVDAASSERARLTGTEDG